MGGYARSVWSAFGISLVVLIITVWLTKRSLTTTQEHLRRRLQSQKAVQT
jgi:heme exporter protein CcmD